MKPHLEAVASGDPEKAAAARRTLTAWVRDEIQSTLPGSHSGSTCDDAAIEAAAATLAGELRTWPPESRDAIADAVHSPLLGPCGRDHALDFLRTFASGISWWKRV
jgi:hypothetical protein